MKCIILAAGYATRLYPFTENFPKPLLDVGGKPILDWLIDDIGDAADEFVVVTNHKFAEIFYKWSDARTERTREKITVRLLWQALEKMRLSCHGRRQYAGLQLARFY